MPATIALVSPQSATVAWYLARGSGFVLYCLLSLGVTVGLLLSLHWRTNEWPRLLTEDLHRFIQLLTGIVLVVHITSTLLDTYVHFAWYQALVPFVAPYRPPWLALGVVAAYIGIVLYLSFYVRRRIGYRTWRTLHYAGFAVWLLALAHGLTSGTDTRASWALPIYGIPTTVVGLLLVARIDQARGTRAWQSGRLMGSLGAIAIGAAVGLALLANGPLQRGWARQVGSVPAPHTVSTLPVVPFGDTLSGIASPYDVYVLDPGYAMLTFTIDGAGRYPVKLFYRVLVRKTPVGIHFIRGLFSLGPPNSAWTCSGTASFKPPDRLLSVCKPGGRRTWRLVAAVRLDVMGRISGHLEVGPAS